VPADNGVMPAWPVWAHDGRWAWVLDDLQPLCTVTTDHLEAGAVHRIQMIDRELKLFRVADVEERGRAGVFGWIPGRKGSHRNVTLSLQLVGQLTLIEAKNVVLEFAREHPGFYEAGPTHGEFFSGIENARSATELFEALRA